MQGRKAAKRLRWGELQEKDLGWRKELKHPAFPLLQASLSSCVVEMKQTTSYGARYARRRRPGRPERRTDGTNSAPKRRSSWNESSRVGCNENGTEEPLEPDDVHPGSRSAVVNETPTCATTVCFLFPCLLSRRKRCGQRGLPRKLLLLHNCLGKVFSREAWDVHWSVSAARTLTGA